MESVAEIQFEDKDLFERWSRVKEDFWRPEKRDSKSIGEIVREFLRSRGARFDRE